MAVLIDKKTKVLVQGITGRTGSFQTKIMKDYGTKIVAGVTPGKGGQEIYGIPIYNFVEEAVAEHDINAAISFVPAKFALDAAYETIDAGIQFMVVTAEGIPNVDILKMIQYGCAKNTKILGPDTPGIISPEKCKMGVHPNRFFKEGNVGVISKSGALSYEVCKSMVEKSVGQSTVVGIGGGPLWGTSQIDVLKLFQEDKETKAIVLLGEIGGTMEEKTAQYIKEHIDKPVVSLIVGRSAPQGKRMGHAGAIIEGKVGTAESKIEILRKCGSIVAKTPEDIPKLLMDVL
ncbi:MAG TPA: succinate--CoA ligase subunit alpha [Thermoplasmatales archaeon]|nr:succinate--CoA ligase subunit alpha [Thermoplasmatales archaeon]